MIKSEIRYFISSVEYTSVEQGNNTLDYMLNRWKSDCVNRIEYAAKNGIIRSYSITKKSGKDVYGGWHVELTMYIRYKYGYDMIELEIYND